MDYKINEKYSREFLASPPLLKKMIPQLILSISIFSFVFSYSSLYSSSPSSLLTYSPNNYKFHYSFPSNSFPFLNHALNKNCLFLICNGLLVFLAKTSGLVRPPPELASSDLYDILQKRIADDLQMPLDQNVPPGDSTAAYDQPKEDENKLDDESNLSTERFSEEVSIMIAESEEEGIGEKDENDEDRGCWLFDEDAEQLYGQEVEEEQDEDEEEREELSTQELNQKFEDFIRRMKEEIMINEARHKVVVLK